MPRRRYSQSSRCYGPSAVGRGPRASPTPGKDAHRGGLPDARRRTSRRSGSACGPCTRRVLQSASADATCTPATDWPVCQGPPSLLVGALTHDSDATTKHAGSCTVQRCLPSGASVHAGTIRCAFCRWPSFGGALSPTPPDVPRKPPRGASTVGSIEATASATRSSMPCWLCQMIALTGPLDPGIRGPGGFLKCPCGGHILRSWIRCCILSVLGVGRNQADWGSYADGERTARQCRSAAPIARAVRLLTFRQRIAQARRLPNELRTVWQHDEA